MGEKEVDELKINKIKVKGKRIEFSCYPTSIESRSDVIRKSVKIIRVWMVIVFLPRSENAVKLFNSRSMFDNFESTLEPK